MFQRDNVQMFSVLHIKNVISHILFYFFRRHWTSLHQTTQIGALVRMELSI
jgi:hypothetical protein